MDGQCAWPGAAALSFSKGNQSSSGTGDGVNFDFSDEQKSLKAEVARVLAGANGLKSARRALEAQAAYDQLLWSELARLGWLGIAMPASYGGQELGHEMLCCVAEEFGRSMAAAPLGSTIYLAAEAILQFGSDAQKRHWLPRIASGELIAAFGFVEGAGAIRASAVRCEVRNGKISGVKVAVTDGALAKLFVVVARENGAPQLYLVEAGADEVSIEAQTGIDPARASAIVRFRGADAERLGDQGWAGIRRLLDRAAVLFAFEQLGVADAALSMALAYARERRAFGRSVGSFQAIKHKLADVWAANELARANAYYAAWALHTDASELPLAAATARVAACEALERAARELIQVHAGIAVTWEHDAHLFYRRGQHLNLVIGGLREWQDYLTELLSQKAA
jgi:alkylation response protein AidB-like acyl-CoA dehydrogenase